MSLQKINSSLLLASINWVNDHPEHHDQSKWHCGTSHCFFGVGEMLGSGLDPACPYDGDSESTQSNAQRLFGLNDSQTEYLSSSARTSQELNQAIAVWTDPFCANLSSYPKIILALSPQNLPAELIAELAKDSDKDVRCAIAERLDLSTELITELAKDSDKDVRCAIAERPDLSTELIAELAKDGHYAVRRAIAERLDLSTELIAELAKDSDEDVRLAIAERAVK